MILAMDLYCLSMFYCYIDPDLLNSLLGGTLSRNYVLFINE